MKQEETPRFIEQLKTLLAERETFIAAHLPPGFVYLEAIVPSSDEAKARIHAYIQDTGNFRVLIRNGGSKNQEMIVYRRQSSIESVKATVARALPWLFKRS